MLEYIFLLAGLLIAPDDNNEVTSIDGILYDKTLTRVNGFPRANKIEKVVFEGTVPPAMKYDDRGAAWADWYANAGYDGDLADRIVESD